MCGFVSVRMGRADWRVVVEGLRKGIGRKEGGVQDGLPRIVASYRILVMCFCFAFVSLERSLPHAVLFPGLAVEHWRCSGVNAVGVLIFLRPARREKRLSFWWPAGRHCACGFTTCVTRVLVYPGNPQSAVLAAAAYLEKSPSVLRDRQTDSGVTVFDKLMLPCRSPRD